MIITDHHEPAETLPNALLLLTQKTDNLSL